jgi:CheY-like chemotaxis protein
MSHGRPFSLRTLVGSITGKPRSDKPPTSKPPASTASARPASKPASKPPVREDGAKMSVFVAEDDPEISHLLVRALSKDYVVHHASDGMMASEMLASLPTPDVILLDVMMPHLDGFSLAKQIKGSDALKAVPLIFLTAKNLPGDVMQGIGLGARHYLQKPFKLADLMDKVARAATR